MVGEVSEGKFVKRVRGSVHMLREPRAWALDVQSLTDAERLGAREVEVVDTETDIRYSATAERIRSKGFRFNRGFGEQVALPLNQWRVQHPGARQLALALEAA